ncbi:MAG TPA: elongation factor P maturation arginine rhamnosyltransferase EarP [Rhodocyclaceae bacterium]|nr:elongation factor P maturation arginine rhamnosyltransferase EarP [Rhodocyclaceae bacterium]
MKKRWDIFCVVVDNYGDAGVCWRLARQLANEHGLAVRLWIDDLTPLARLCPETDIHADQQLVAGVDVRRWSPDFPQTESADVVVEAFACELPQPYLAAMAACNPRPCWINLEYLSAESWVEGCHRMASPHGSLPLTKHFFFPGFTEKTGGLLKERDYETRRKAFDSTAFREALNLPRPRADELLVSLFGYENGAVNDLLSAWAQGATPITCLVPEGRLLPDVCNFLQVAEAKPGDRFARGALTLQVLPFLPQDDYDRLLWLCDLNFVRGEDSFVRAQWAAKPFVWHIYLQEEAHHRIKLQAFLDRYVQSLAPGDAAALAEFWWAWEAGSGAGAAWSSLQAVLPALTAHARDWATDLGEHPDLAAQLVSFSLESS